MTQQPILALCDELGRLAEKARSGEWQHSGNGHVWNTWTLDDGHRAKKPVAECYDADNANHIGACSPDNIKRLITALRDAMEALRPFSVMGAQMGDGIVEGIIWPDNLRLQGVTAYRDGKDHYITMGDLRRAHKALKAAGES